MLDSLFSLIYNLVYYGVIALVVLAVSLYFFQDKLIYQPNPILLNCPTPETNPSRYKKPSERGLDYEDLYLTGSDGVRIHTWFIKAIAPKGTVVFFHANAGNLGFRMDNYEMFASNLQMNVFAVSYRGYGYSEGKPSETGLMRDADAVMHYVYTQLPVDRRKVFLFGRSLGGAVSIYAASKYTDYQVLLT